MATANITREEAAARSDLVQAKAYRVTVDVTGDGVEDKEHNFLSRTEFDFSSKSGSTHLDIIADEIRSATLDGVALPLEGFDGYRLPLADLTEGDHTVVVEAVGRYSHTGEGLHRFVDTDGKVYLYSQFETADARRMYATFEQPDQKATFQLTVLAPAEWSVFSNSPSVDGVPAGEGVARFEFAPTPRMSTYITALVAGEYHVVKGEITSAKGVLPAAVACRASMAEFLDADTILTTTQRGFEVFEAAFGVPYAFDSYDQIFVPEFNFGAMENAGCVTFRDQYVFRSRVTAREMEARDNTILHELAHMWFGDLVTMRWWDDLWLNESFAEWASHYAADEIARKHGTDSHPWVSFSNERKGWAYLQDQLSTTHPIAADMSDLEKVEQNFDGITYAKGASVLKLLVSFVGIDSFLKGVGEYFTKHAFGNTTLADLLTELEAASGRDLSWFASEWLETSGVNTLRAEFEVDEKGTFTRFAIVQTAPEQHPTLRTHRLGIGIYAVRDEALERIDYVEIDVKGERTEVPELVGRSRGAVVLLNDGDLTFAKVRLDDASRAALVAHINGLHDPLARAITWSLFWDAVRDAEIAPQELVSLALAGIGSEKDMAAVTTVLAQAAACSGRFTAPELREQANARLVAGLAGLLRDAEPGSDAQLIIAKTLIGTSRSPEALELIKVWLSGEEVPTDLSVDTELRWLIVTALARAGVFGEEEIAAELERDNTNAGAERAAGARAGIPTADAKSAAWQLAAVDASVPNETHRSIASGFVHYGQDEVLAPYVDAYADLLQKVSKREDGWETRGYAAIGTALRWLFPEPLATREVVDRFRRYLEEGEPTDQVRRLLSERLDEAERNLRVQERSRA
ncbi:aminopeptidase N [Arachnia propionica]|uniref:Aminopeptidase N n=1 Tax=Arachnia propionica TaxID=1750 RepID=A0A3P1WRK7_9ACTN|nr:aminopeptidase N [Arachnia propionica]RRD49244.1 aminopeptidase N [Arachnia propionica]